MNKTIELTTPLRDHESPVPKIWGMSPAGRIRKQIDKNGDIRPEPGHKLIIRDDGVFDTAVLAGLALTPGTLVKHGRECLAAHVSETESHTVRAALTQKQIPVAPDLQDKSPESLGNAYRDELRKRETPFALVLDDSNKKAVEWHMYKGAYKGVTDLVTKYLWPVPAFHATRLCAALGLTPNMVTTVGAILMFLALGLFWYGYYGWGLLAGWIMTFLDTVDGKLARVTLTSSKWGNVFDHGIDLIHPPFWYIAWGIGLSAYGTPLVAGTLTPLLVVMFLFYVLGRLCEGYFIKRFGIHLHVWRRVDSLFRLVSARRNPNMIVLTLSLVAGRPDIGLIVIVAWTVITFFLHLVQIAQAEWARARRHHVRSWLQQAPA